MFDSIGLGELLVLAFIGLIVVKPEDLPQLMRKIGIFAAMLQAYVRGMWDGWQEQMESGTEKHDLSK